MSLKIMRLEYLKTDLTVNTKQEFINLPEVEKAGDNNGTHAKTVEVKFSSPDSDNFVLMVIFC